MRTTTVQSDREAATDLDSHRHIRDRAVERPRDFCCFLERTCLYFLQNKRDRHAIKAKSRRRDDAKPTGLTRSDGWATEREEQYSSPLRREERSIEAVVAMERFMRFSLEYLSASRIPASEQRRRSACVRLLTGSSIGNSALGLGSRRSPRGSIGVSIPGDVFLCRTLRPIVTARLVADAAIDNDFSDLREK